MRSLGSYLEKSLNMKLSDFEDSKDNITKAIDKAMWGHTEKWIKENYIITQLQYFIDEKTGIFRASSPSLVRTRNSNLKSLTNENFIWDSVKDFDCLGCNSLTSLKRIPQIVKEDFHCAFCNSLISLEGVSKKGGGGIIYHTDYLNLIDCVGFTNYEK